MTSALDLAERPLEVGVGLSALASPAAPQPLIPSAAGLILTRSDFLFLAAVTILLGPRSAGPYPARRCAAGAQPSKQPMLAVLPLIFGLAYHPV